MQGSINIRVLQLRFHYRDDQCQNHSYEGNDGTKRYTTDITAEEIEFLSTKGDATTDGAGAMPAADTGLQPIDDDDNTLPF